MNRFKGENNISFFVMACQLIPRDITCQLVNRKNRQVKFMAKQTSFSCQQLRSLCAASIQSFSLFRFETIFSTRRKLSDTQWFCFRFHFSVRERKKAATQSTIQVKINKERTKNKGIDDYYLFTATFHRRSDERQAKRK